jgi:RHS repeat-associated protein
MLLPPGTAPNTATWTPNVAQAGQYEVYARWTQSANRATNATYTVTHAAGSSAIPVNQQQGGGVWNLLGTFSLSQGGMHKVSLTDQANGFVIADAIRLVPVAVQAEKKLYFIHVDHLNTPRLIADSTRTTVWRWDQIEAFGANVPDESPFGFGDFVFPLRLPGQYHDGESGLSYNYHRDYDPGLGRYVQSDPIGIEGGINSYVYARAVPMLLSDSMGLSPNSACGGDPDPCRKFAEVSRVYSGHCQSPCVKVPGYIQLWTCWEYVRSRKPLCACTATVGPRG